MKKCECCGRPLPESSRAENLVKDWIKTNPPSVLPNSVVQTNHLFTEFDLWAKQRNGPQLNSVSFGMGLSKAMPEVCSRQVRVKGGRRVRVYVFPKTKRPAKPTRETVWSDEDLLDL